MLRYSISGLFALMFFSVTIAQNNITNPENKSREIRNVILLIGDGMGLAQMYSAYTLKGDALNIMKCPYIGLSKTNSSDEYVTDSAAGATALSTGHKTKNGSLAVDSTGRSLKTILEIAEEHGLATGLVVTCAITHATPAAFVAHNYDRNVYEGIALDFLKTDIDLFIGGGKKYFSNRKDNRDLLLELKKNGYQITSTMDEVLKIDTGKIAGFVADTDLPKISEGRKDMLPNATEKAIQILRKNKKGFFLMVEGSQIDWGNHYNNIDYVTNEVIDFDKAVGKALEFASKDGHTLVIVTADHESGGLVLVDGSFSEKRVKAKFETHLHSAVPVPVYAFGPGAEVFTGFYENTSIFYKMLNAYGFSVSNSEK